MNPETLQAAALDVAQALDPKRALRTIVEGLAQEPCVALARIWLRGPGDVCDSCTFQAECPDRTECLHLRASAGASVVDPALDWTRIDGSFRRFPLGVRQVGAIGASGEPRLHRCEDGLKWLARPAWAADEGIGCFAGHPLAFRGEVLGALAVFSREPVTDEAFGWLHTFAHQAAVANARAFAEVTGLKRQLKLERDYLREEIETVRAGSSIVGTSAAIRRVLEQVDVVAPTDASVLIEGESGTGKELVATAVHDASPRAERTLVRVNCASIPHELFESEFFGHVKGSFTGAVRDRAGRFQVADGGTLFLDEVGEIPLDLQGKLLRALQEGRFSRIGEERERAVDVRVVAATNRDLAAEVAAGRFREDLFYRLSVFPIRVPPLRERSGDIAALAQRFVETGSWARSGPRPELRARDVEALASYDWPGNVRELQNVIERALIGARGGRLALELPIAAKRAEPTDTAANGPALLTFDEVQQLERRNLLAVLDEHRWKIAGPGSAAEFLGVRPTTLTSRMKAMGIHRPGKEPRG
ncbi:MAG: sigma 54-interacting transcriptional regulator [Planctomycetota bacterium]